MTRLNPDNIRDVDLLASVDSGEFDGSTPSAVLMLLAKWIGVQECKAYADVTDIRFFRALVTQLWIINHSHAYEEPVFITGDQPGSLSLTPANVRSVLISDLEAPIAKRYGAERTEAEIRNFYLLMLAYGQGREVTLSPFGVEVLAKIHRSILQDAIYGNSRAKRGLH
ncbi:hypothetical protein JQ91_002459 [Salmonella enterica subsp. enterica]|nr:hypothetical protein [Salmonella enterica subsp. enterica]EDR2559389.1 hypothetical protein [Salmonella enterica subsp. enterica]EDR2617572.1 hypothetical protein [Salmonella enterica subsp. enterica]